MRKALGLVLVVGMLLVIAAMPAAAAPAAGTFLFRAVAWSPNLCYPGISEITPGCAKNAPYSLKMQGYTDVNNNGIFGDAGDFDHNSSANFCVGLASNAGLAIEQGGASVQGECDISDAGQVSPGPRALNGAVNVAAIGGYCGGSHGEGRTSTRVNGVTVTEDIEWIQSAGTVLPVTDRNPFNSLHVAGVVDAIGAVGGGSCGLNGPPSVGFNVIGVSTAVSTS